MDFGPIEKGAELPDGIEFDGEVYWATCPDCGVQQGDLGRGVCCDNCGYGPMPTYVEEAH